MSMDEATDDPICTNCGEARGAVDARGECRRCAEATVRHARLHLTPEEMGEEPDDL